MRLMTLTSIAVAALAWSAVGQAAGPYDGTYRGSQKTLRTNNSSVCANLDRDNVTIRIVDSKFSRTWGQQNAGGDSVEVTVAAEGTLKGQAAALSDRTSRGGTRTFEMTGKITDGTLVAEFGSNRCAVTLTLKKG